MHACASKLWAVILAGGQGRRLEGLTRRLGGDVRKQFHFLMGDRSLLQRTVERAAKLVPPERMMVVVTDDQQEAAWSHLERWPAIRLVVQPSDRDTGPAILLALSALLQADPEGRVVVMPSDHHVKDAAPLLQAIGAAAEAAAWDLSSASVLGAVPDSADGDHDWIFPGTSLERFRLHRVLCFAENAPGSTLARLHRTSAVWNTSILVGTIRRLWQVGCAGLPRHAARIAVAMDGSSLAVVDMLAETYASLPAASFGAAALERAAGISVRPFAAAGWSDWDTPHRVFDSLHGTPELTGLLARIGPASPWRRRPAPGQEPVSVASHSWNANVGRVPAARSA